MMTCPFCSASVTAGAVLCSACGRSLINVVPAVVADALPAGTALHNGAYVVREALGQGGFGITYFGGDIHLRRYVAIKEFYPLGCRRVDCDVAPDGGLAVLDFERARAKFLEEAQALARFHHPHIVGVYNCFEQHDTAYMVMEYLHGQTLEQLVEERGALPAGEAVGYVEKVGEALVAVHGANLVHRDITPSNVIVCDDGRVVLFDFGLSRQVEVVATKGTRQLGGTGRLGTSGFAPPEQYLQNAELGAFTDVYALAAMLYYLLTGEVPLQAFDRAMGTALTPPHEAKAKVNRSVSDAVMWAMQLKPEDRPQTVPDFINAVGVALRGEGATGSRFRIRRRDSRAAAPDVPFDPALFDAGGINGGGGSNAGAGGNGAGGSNGTGAVTSVKNVTAAARPASVRPRASPTGRRARQVHPRLHTAWRFALDRALILFCLGIVLGIGAGYGHGAMAMLRHVSAFAVAGAAAGFIIGFWVGITTTDRNRAGVRPAPRHNKP